MSDQSANAAIAPVTTRVILRWGHDLSIRPSGLLWKGDASAVGGDGEGGILRVGLPKRAMARRMATV